MDLAQIYLYLGIVLGAIGGIVVVIIIDYVYNQFRLQKEREKSIFINRTIFFGHLNQKQQEEYTKLLSL